MTAINIRLGVLDVSPVWPGTNDREVIWQTLDLGPMLEEWGYDRYWMAEHHAENAAHSSPELIVPIVAGMTERLRIGVAGVLLQLHSPFKVAKDFRLLEAIYADRIDLGIARGDINHDQALLLRDGAPPSGEYEDRVIQLLSYLRGTSQTSINPRFVPSPSIWMLGSGSTSARIAASQGTRFTFATQFKGQHLEAGSVIRKYCDDFQPSITTPNPECNISVAGICAPTDESAASLLEKTNFKAMVVGSQKTCAHRLQQLQQDTGVSEFIWLDLCRLNRNRLTSYQLLAEVLELGC